MFSHSHLNLEITKQSIPSRKLQITIKMYIHFSNGSLQLAFLQTVKIKKQAATFLRKGNMKNGQSKQTLAFECIGCHRTC